MSIYIFLFIWVWIMCGLLHFGYFLQYFQTEFPLTAKKHFEEHLRNALMGSFLGIIALITTVISGFTIHGLYPLHKIKEYWKNS